jgi:uncharacterized Zn finger protein
MDSIADLVEESAMRKLATPSNFRLGKQIADANGVEFVEYEPLKVVAKVAMPGILKRTVTFTSTKEGLQYKCSCSNKPNHFCKHCVATGLVIWEKAPKSKK